MVLFANMRGLQLAVAAVVQHRSTRVSGLVDAQPGQIIAVCRQCGQWEISVFRVRGSILFLTDVVPSGGGEPDAIAQHGNLVYVLNAGGSSNVVGFRLLFGQLRPIRNSVRFLSTNTSGASSLAFSPDGRFLVVTERLTNNIDVFHVMEDGTLSPAVINPGVGPGTFSLVFAPNGAALVTETGAGGVPNASAVSSYAVLPQAHSSPLRESSDAGRRKLLERCNSGWTFRLQLQCWLGKHCRLCDPS